VKIQVVKNWKALTQLEWSDVPAFVVLTGTNGTGKSQLLLALYNHFCGDQASPVRVEGFSARGHEALYRTSEWALRDPAGVGFTTLQQNWTKWYERYQWRVQPAYKDDSELFERAFSEAERAHGVGRGALTPDQVVSTVSIQALFESSDILADQVSQIFMQYRSRQADALLGSRAVAEPPPVGAAE
jgi:hypothetical protein